MQDKDYNQQSRPQAGGENTANERLKESVVHESYADAIGAEPVIEVEEVRKGRDVCFEPIIGSVDIFEDIPEKTKKKGIRRWIFAAAFGFVLIILAVAVLSGKAVDEPDSMAVDVVKTEDEIYKATYVERELLCEGCGHTVTDILHGDSRFVGMTFSQLEAEGWRVTKTGSNEVRIYRKVRGFCDEDSAKRTLRLTESGLGIYEGPKNAEGDLLNEMVIDSETLPDDMKTQLSGDGMEFANEDELSLTLDSLDEYVGYEDGSYYSGIV